MGIFELHCEALYFIPNNKFNYGGAQKKINCRESRTTPKNIMGGSGKILKIQLCRKCYYGEVKKFLGPPPPPHNFNTIALNVVNCVSWLRILVITWNVSKYLLHILEEGGMIDYNFGMHGLFDYHILCTLQGDEEDEEDDGIDEEEEDGDGEEEEEDDDDNQDEEGM